MYWLDAVRQQAIIWANGDLDLFRHKLSLDHPERSFTWIKHLLWTHFLLNIIQYDHVSDIGLDNGLAPDMPQTID